MFKVDPISCHMVTWKPRLYLFDELLKNSSATVFKKNLHKRYMGSLLSVLLGLLIYIYIYIYIHTYDTMNHTQSSEWGLGSLNGLLQPLGARIARGLLPDDTLFPAPPWTGVLDHFNMHPRACCTQRNFSEAARPILQQVWGSLGPEFGIRGETGPQAAFIIQPWL